MRQTKRDAQPRQESRVKPYHITTGNQIITEFERGSIGGAWALIAMFVVLSIGAAVFGW